MHRPGLLAVVSLLALLGCDGGADRVGEGEGEPGGEGEGEGEPGGEGEGEGEPGGEGEGEGEPGGEGEGEPSCDDIVALDCASGTLTLDTADGAARIDAYTCSDPTVSGFTYEGRELLFAFTNEEPAHVTVRATRTGAGSTTYQLFDLGEGGDPCAPGRGCVGVVDEFAAAPLAFDAGAGATRYLSYDPRGNFAAGDTTTLTLQVECVLVGCGNGLVEPGEACDDGDADGGDGCSASCDVEDGYACEGAGPGSCAQVVCGDGVIDGDEACDDNDQAPGDGCDADCRTEPGFVCGGAPSICVAGSGETCAEALPLGPNTSATFDSSGFDNDVDSYSGACVFFSGEGPDVFYAVDVPGGEVLTATLSDDFNGSVLALVTDSAAPASSCEVASAAEVSFANHGAGPRQVFVAVDGALGARTSVVSGQPLPPDQGAFTLTTQTRPMTSLAPSDVCATAQPLTIGVAVTGTTIGHLGTANGFGGGGCGGGFTRTGQGRDAFYSITVPANRTLRAAVTNAAGNGDVVVGVVADCSNPRATCLADADVGSQLASETAVFTNASGVAREVFVVVDAISANAGFSFTLTATLE